MTRLRNFLFLLVITALAVALPARTVKADPGSGYVLCSCQLCSQSDVVCRISPSGYSILCSDYYRLHCISNQ